VDGHKETIRIPDSSIDPAKPMLSAWEIAHVHQAEGKIPEGKIKRVSTLPLLRRDPTED